MEKSKNILPGLSFLEGKSFKNLKLASYILAALTLTSCDKTTVDPVGPGVENQGNKILTGDATLLSPTKTSITSRYVNFSVKPYSTSSSSITITLNGNTNITLSKNPTTGNFEGLSPEIVTGNYSITIIEKNGSESKITNGGSIAFTQVVPNDVTANQKNQRYDEKGGLSMDKDSLDMMKVQFPNYLKNKDKIFLHVIDWSINTSSVELSNITTKNRVTGGNDGGTTTGTHGTAVGGGAFATVNNNIGMSGTSSLDKDHQIFHAVGKDYQKSDGTTSTYSVEEAYVSAFEYIKDIAMKNPDQFHIISISNYVIGNKANALFWGSIKKIPNILLISGTGNDGRSNLDSQQFVDVNSMPQLSSDILFGGVEGNDLSKANPRTLASNQVLVAVPSSFMSVLQGNGTVKNGSGNISEISFGVPMGAGMVADVLRACRGEPGFNKQELISAIAEGAIDIKTSSNTSVTGSNVDLGRDPATGYGLFNPANTLKILAKRHNINVDLNQ